MMDFNHGSGFVYGRGNSVPMAGERINALIDAALEAERRTQPPRDYLGASRIGDPCARKLAYEYTRMRKDREFNGRTLRIFDAGHQFEALAIQWMRAAGFELRTHKRNGEQFGFEVAGGRIRGHIDGVIVAGPDVGIAWPALWEHKALKASSWSDLVKRGVRVSKPLYFAQVQIYMGYLAVPVTLFSAMNKDTQELFHEVVAFDPAAAQSLSDKAVDVIRAVEAGDLPPRIAAAPNSFFCRFCDYAETCWRTAS